MSLANRTSLLEQFADTVLAQGAHVSWAPTAVEARAHIGAVLRDHAATRVAISTSRATSSIGEEVALNVALHSAGAELVETDLILAQAQVGIAGADLAVAETGSMVLVTGDDNGRLVAALPRVLVVLLGMERMTATWDQAEVLLSWLARSANGQRLGSYTNVVTGTRHAYELDGPDELHVVLLDNGRRHMLGSSHHEVPSSTGAVAVPLHDMLLSLRRENAGPNCTSRSAAWQEGHL